MAGYTYGIRPSLLWFTSLLLCWSCMWHYSQPMWRQCEIDTRNPILGATHVDLHCWPIRFRIDGVSQCQCRSATLVSSSILLTVLTHLGRFILLFEVFTSLFFSSNGSHRYFFTFPSVAHLITRSHSSTSLFRLACNYLLTLIFNLHTSIRFYVFMRFMILGLCRSDIRTSPCWSKGRKSQHTP